MIRASSPGRNGAIVKQEWALIPTRSGLHFFVAVWFPENLLPVAFIIKANKRSQASDEKANTKDLAQPTLASCMPLRLKQLFMFAFGFPVRANYRKPCLQDFRYNTAP